MCVLLLRVASRARPGAVPPLSLAPVRRQLVGVVSMRHTHGVRFGQADIYVVVKLLATSEEIKMDPHEVCHVCNVCNVCNVRNVRNVRSE